MKDIIRIIFVLALFSAIMVVPAMAASTVYFVPDDIRADGYCDTEIVSIYVNTDQVIKGGHLEFDYTFCCANVTGYTPNSVDWDFMNSASVTPGKVVIGFGTLDPAGRGPGLLHVGDIEVHCCNASSCCGTTLVWNEPLSNIELSGGGFDSPVTYEDATFLCGDVLDVTKEIWDESTTSWVNHIGPLGSDMKGKDVRFKITVTSKCLEFSNVVVDDVMDSRLVYNNSAVPGENSNTTHTANWILGALPASTSTSIEFNATIVDYGTGVNTATVTATVADPVVDVIEEASASEQTMPPAGIEVNKTVWNPVTGEWVDLLEMQIIDEVDIGDPASEAGHNLQGWGPALNASCTTWGGSTSYGSRDGGGDLRVTWAQGNDSNCGDCPGVPPVPTYCSVDIAPCCGDDGNDSSASFTMNNPGHAKQLQLRVLDGSADDSFDVYINGILAYSYTGNGGSEDWVTHEIMVPISERNVDPLVITVEATGDPGTLCPWGQLAINWAKLYTWPQIGDTYRFRCEMHNIGSPGMDLSLIEVWDVISPSLEYADSAMIMTPNGVWRSIEPPTSISPYDPVNGTTVNWTIDPFLQDPLILQPCQTFVIEYNVTVIDYGLDCNIQYAKGWCATVLQFVQGDDDACINTPKPDLNVTDITVNYDLYKYAVNRAFGPTYHPGFLTQPNKISADITELNGVDIIDSFEVTFEINGVPVETVTVPGLAAGATTTVYCDDKFFPMAGDTYTITVTADSLAHPPGEISETDEGNNAMAKDITATILGYKGNHYQDGRNLTTLQYHEGTVNLIYSPGDSYYLSSYYNPGWTTYEANWTTADLSMPAQDTCIKKARLYVYYNWDKTPDRNITDYFSMEFNGYTVPMDAHYSDVKWPGHNPYGMVAYDVANEFLVTNSNTATLINNYPGGGKVSMDGMLLVIVYNHSTEPERTIIINEGYDMLTASTTGASYNYGVTSEEATAYANFTGCTLPDVAFANLITVAPGASDGDDSNRLYFNDGMWKGIWNGYPALPTQWPWRSGISHFGQPQLGMNETVVTEYLKPTDNYAGFQSHIPDGGVSGDGFRAANAFLIVEMGKPEMSADPVPPETGDCYKVGEQFDVLINIDPMGAPIMGAQFDLHFNQDSIHAETVTYGTFLTWDGTPVFVSHSDIDNTNGVVEFAAARQGTPIGVTEPGTFAIVHFTAETAGTISELNLENALATDNHSVTYTLVTHNGQVEVCANTPPDPVPESNFTYNNIAEKGLSNAFFIGTDSSDPDGDTLTEYRWWVDDGSGLIGEIAVHQFEVPMYWVGDSSGHYVPADVTLRVTDDGVPPMAENETMQVSVYIGGDTDGDGIVNIADAVKFGIQFMATCNKHPVTGLNWYDNPDGDMADLDNDEHVNIADAMLLGTCWGHTAWD